MIVQDAQSSGLIRQVRVGFAFVPLVISGFPKAGLLTGLLESYAPVFAELDLRQVRLLAPHSHSALYQDFGVQCFSTLSFLFWLCALTCQAPKQASKTGKNHCDLNDRF